MAVGAAAALFFIWPRPFRPARRVRAAEPAAGEAGVQAGPRPGRAERAAWTRPAALLVLLPSWLLPVPHLPTWAERWMTNPRADMDRAIDSTSRASLGAGAPADTAVRLAPDDPLVPTTPARSTSAPGMSARPPLLEKAAQAPRPLASRAFYTRQRPARRRRPARSPPTSRRVARDPGYADAKTTWAGLRASSSGARSRAARRGERPNQGSRGNPKPGADNPADPTRADPTPTTPANSARARATSGKGSNT